MAALKYRDPVTGAFVTITGPPGPPGPPGPAGGGSANYRHVQTTAASTWTITHNLGFYPSVTVVDSAGTEVWPGDVRFTSVNSVTLTFSAAFGGEAYFS